MTDRDLALKVVAEGRDAKSTRVEAVMTRKVVTCRAEDNFQKALDAMSEHQLRRIPVVDGEGRILGIIAQADVATRVNQPDKTAEVLRDGWYNTGDIARIDEDGFIFILDRLSRYSKIGGEMVPHLAIEEKYQHALGALGHAVAVTSAPDENRGEQLVVLFLINTLSMKQCG